MKAETFVKIGLALAFVTMLLFWQDVWAWMDSKPPMDIALDILGFCLKWFYLALLAFLMATLPHYVKPWLKLARLSGRRRLRAARRGGLQVEARTTMPRVNKNEALVWMMGQMAKSQAHPSLRSPKTSTAKIEDVELRF